MLIWAPAYSGSLDERQMTYLSMFFLFFIYIYINCFIKRLRHPLNNISLSSAETPITAVKILNSTQPKSYTELLAVWGNYDFTKKHFWLPQKSIMWSSPQLDALSCSSIFHFLHQLLFPICLPHPLCGLWAAKSCLGRHRVWQYTWQ